MFQSVLRATGRDEKRNKTCSKQDASVQDIDLSPHVPFHFFSTMDHLQKVLDRNPEFSATKVWYGGNSIEWAAMFTAFPQHEVSNALRPEAFPLFPLLVISAAFLLSRCGTLPKSESGVGLTQFIGTRRIPRCSSRRRMLPSQFHLLSLVRTMKWLAIAISMHSNSIRSP